VAFTTAPLRLAVVTGFITVLIAIIYALYRMIRYGFLFSTDSILIMLFLFFSGVSMSFMGIIGEYIARIYKEVKRRPIYITKESNCDDDPVRVISQSHYAQTGASEN
jgi:glycosyltransferase involved in cell wall biosynthesis